MSNKKPQRKTISYADLVRSVRRHPALRDQISRDVSSGHAHTPKTSRQYLAVIRYFASNDAAYEKFQRDIDGKARDPRPYVQRQPKRTKKRQPKRAKKRQSPKTTPKTTPTPITPPTKWRKLPPIYDPIELSAYTYRTEALVTFNARYPRMSFTPRAPGDIGAAAEARDLQIFHTPFRQSERAALEDFRERIAIMRAYGIVTFVEITYWRIIGEGSAPKKHWTLLATYDAPEDVPGFNHAKAAKA